MPDYFNSQGTDGEGIIVDGKTWTVLPRGIWLFGCCLLRFEWLCLNYLHEGGWKLATTMSDLSEPPVVINGVEHGNYILFLYWFETYIHFVDEPRVFYMSTLTLSVRSSLVWAVKSNATRAFRISDATAWAVDGLGVGVSTTAGWWLSCERKGTLTST